MHKEINTLNTHKGLFLTSREDYIDKIGRLIRLINEKYPEIADSAEFSGRIKVIESDSLEDVVKFYERLYQKIKEYNRPGYRPYWIFNTKFYS